MKRKYFVRKFLSYFLLFALPMLALCGTLYFYTSHTLRTELEQRTKHTAVMASDAMQMILESGHKQTLLFSNNAALRLSLVNMLNQNSTEYREYTIQSVASSILENLNMTDNLIDNAYVYIENEAGNYFQSDKKIVSLAQSHDTSWYNSYRAAPPVQNFWVELRETRYYSFETTRPVLSVFRRIGGVEGVVVINLNTAALGARLEKLEAFASEVLVVADAQSKPLFSNRNGTAFLLQNPDALAMLPRQYLATAGGALFPVDIDGTDYLVTKISAGQYNLHYYSLVESAVVYGPLHRIVLFGAICLLGGVVLTLCLSYIVTERNFRQINYLLSTFHTVQNGGELPDTFQLPAARDEYGVVLNDVLQTFIRNHTLQLSVKELQISKQTAELAALQLQINPHFFFNTLQSIELEAMKTQGPHAPLCTLIHNLSDILRYALKNPSQWVPLSEELLNCKRYVEIQQFANPNRFFVFWECEPCLANRPVMRLLLQPLIENSIEHGVKAKSGSCAIRIRVAVHGSALQFSITDNGEGMQRNALLALRASLATPMVDNSLIPSHIGLRNIHKRLLLAEQGNPGLRIFSHAGLGTRVSFSLHSLTVPGASSVNEFISCASTANSIHGFSANAPHNH